MSNASNIETVEQCAERIVRQEVMLCVSSLVSTLAQGAFNSVKGDLSDLCEQAFALSYPTPDHEEAARQAGWLFEEGCDPGILDAVLGEGATQRREYGNKGETPNDIAQRLGLEPCAREVFEHWAVSDWLADKLEALGERVDRDFAGMNVWARTCTGQGIANDSPFLEIARQILSPTKTEG